MSKSRKFFQFLALSFILGLLLIGCGEDAKPSNPQPTIQPTVTAPAMPTATVVAKPAVNIDAEKARAIKDQLSIFKKNECEVMTAGDEKSIPVDIANSMKVEIFIDILKPDGTSLDIFEDKFPYMAGHAVILTDGKTRYLATAFHVLSGLLDIAQKAKDGLSSAAYSKLKPILKFKSSNGESFDIPLNVDDYLNSKTTFPWGLKGSKDAFDKIAYFQMLKDFLPSVKGISLAPKAELLKQTVGRLVCDGRNKLWGISPSTEFAPLRYTGQLGTDSYYAKVYKYSNNDLAVTSLDSSRKIAEKSSGSIVVVQTANGEFIPLGIASAYIESKLFNEAAKIEKLDYTSDNQPIVYLSLLSMYN